MGTTKQLPGTCQAAGQQLHGSCLAGNGVRQLRGSCLAAVRQLPGRFGATAWLDVVLVLIVVGRAVCCAFSALNGN